MKKTDPQRAGLFFVILFRYFWDCKLITNMYKPLYHSPDAEWSVHTPECVLASSFNEDDNTEIFDYEDGGFI